jgi:hypothetical protein
MTQKTGMLKTRAMSFGCWPAMLIEKLKLVSCDRTTVSRGLLCFHTETYVMWHAHSSNSLVHQNQGLISLSH